MDAQTETVPRIERIPITRIVATPTAIRSNLRLDDEFLQDIKTGIRQPLIIRPLEQPATGIYEVVVGMRRFEAARRVGMAELPCMVMNLTEREAYFERVRENYHRQNLNGADLAQYIRKGRDEFGFTTLQMSENLHIKKIDVER